MSSAGILKITLLPNYLKIKKRGGKRGNTVEILENIGKG